jgi:CHRD domain
MQATILRSSLIGLAFGTLVFGAAPALAEMVNLKGDLKASSEVPANDSKATGSFTATYDTASKKLSWKGTYSGLTGNATAAHFHGPAEAGKNAGVVVPFKETGPSFSGTADLTDAQAADLMAGKWYVNVHTQANPGGEIRGQVMK